jgi:hypothetical protein
MLTIQTMIEKPSNASSNIVCFLKVRHMLQAYLHVHLNNLPVSIIITRDRRDI